MTTTEHTEHIEAAETIRALRAQVEALNEEKRALKKDRYAHAVAMAEHEQLVIERDAALALAAGRLVDAERWQKVKIQRSDYHGDCYVMMFAPDGDFPPDKHVLNDIVDRMKSDAAMQAAKDAS